MYLKKYIYMNEHKSEGTKRPLGTETPYVQQANRKKNMDKIPSVFKLNVPEKYTAQQKFSTDK